VVYLVRIGTVIILRKPAGEIVAHWCWRDCLFQTYERLGEHKTLRIGQGGFVVTVDAAHVVEVRYRYPPVRERAGERGAVREVQGEVLPWR